MPLAVNAAGTEYSFVIYSNEAIFSLDYDGEYVTVSFSMSVGEPAVLRHSRVSMAGETTEGGVAFLDSSDKTVADVGCKSDGSGAYIIYLDSDGRYARVTGKGSDKEFLAEFKSLKNALSGPSTSSEQRRSSAGRLAAKGDITAARLATHPIGFLPSDWRSEADIMKAIREEGWPESKNFRYRADLNFKVPFTLNGAEIWDCGWSFNRGRLTMYYMDTYPMSGTVTEKRILTYVDKLLDSLTANGFELLSHKVENPGRGNMYDWELSKGATKVEITANSAGKVFFVVRVK